MDLEAVRRYLDGWKDPRRGPLAAALSEGQEKAALAFAESREMLPLPPGLAEAKAVLSLIVGAGVDLIFRDISLGRDARPATLFFVDGMAKLDIIMMTLESLTVHLRQEALPDEPDRLLPFLKERGLVASAVKTLRTVGDVVTATLSGDTVLLVDGMAAGIEFATRGWEHRKPEEPVTEPAVRGPKEGFTETVAVNLTLVRRRLQDPRLRVDAVRVGTRTATTVFVVYMAGLTYPELVDEVKSRLQRVNIDGVIDSGYLEELIADTTLTPFPLLRATERPDVVTAGILEGRVALLVDGTPHVLLAPKLFSDGLQAAEDYYLRWPNGAFIRVLRYVYLMVALLGPSVYIALLSYHQEMLPTNLLLSIMGAREGVPFPALVEALLMEISFEALREAGVRLPKNVGQAVSIVGALVIGEAAVKAGLVSPAMVIVVAITGISSFVIPLYGSALAIRLLRFPMMVLAGVFGFVGLTLGLIVLSVHLASLRSFGVPYMTPTMPPSWTGMKDMMIRAPWWMMKKRPKAIPMLDRQRIGGSQRPQPPGSDSFQGKGGDPDA